jgi:hypothetical protein
LKSKEKFDNFLWRCGRFIENFRNGQKNIFVAASDLDLDPENTSGFGQNDSDLCGSGSMIMLESSDNGIAWCP